MRALLTGASSFSGYWLAAKLHATGFDVVAPLRRSPASYDGVRGERVRRLAEVAELLPNCAFGGETFLELVQSRTFDVLCHHAGRVTDYGSRDFDVLTALAGNTNNIRCILGHMQ